MKKLIGILNRWRQFGRRYFWPHLLLGVVAAGFGIPVLNGSTEPTQSAEASSSSHIARWVTFNSLVQLQESTKRPSFSMYYWHQHAIRNVIRHFSFAMAPQALLIAQESQFQAQHLVLLNTLSALLTLESKPPVIVRITVFHETLIDEVFSTVTWIRQVQGIRAGPMSLNAFLIN